MRMKVSWAASMRITVEPKIISDPKPPVLAQTSTGTGRGPHAQGIAAMPVPPPENKVLPGTCPRGLLFVAEKILRGRKFAGNVAGAAPVKIYRMKI